MHYFYLWGEVVAKLKSIANKLQTALAMNGRYITINQNQFYSERLEKMCTKYILKEKMEIDDKMQNVTLLETFRIVDVVNFLADLLNGGE